MARRTDTGRTTTAPVPPAVPGAPSAPAAPPGPSASPAPVPPSGAASATPHPGARAVARASLAAGRSPSLWWACTGIGVALAVTFVVGASQGALVLAAVLGVSAVARALLRPGPVALTVRSRVLDSAVLAGLALGVGFLAQIIPDR